MTSNQLDELSPKAAIIAILCITALVLLATLTLMILTRDNDCRVACQRQGHQAGVAIRIASWPPLNQCLCRDAQMSSDEFR